MKVKARTKKRDGYIVNLQVTVPLEEFQPAIDTTMKKLGQKVRIPGFRPGHVPANILENHLGIDYILSQAVDEVLQDSYVSAVDKLKLVPVDQPEIDIKTLEKGKDLVYDVTVLVKPEVELGEYKGIEIEKKVLMPDDEDVDKELEQMRERLATETVLDADAAIETNDEAVIDYEGFVDDVAFPGGRGDNYGLVIGSNTFIPGFEDQLIGHKTGEEVEVKVTFPEQYHSEELAGKNAIFKVKIKEVKRKDLPDLDDDFAKDMSESCETLADFREKIKEDLIKEAENRATSAAKRDAIQKAIDNAKVDLPPVMIENRLNQMDEEFENQLKYQGLTLERFLQLSKMTKQDMREKNRPAATLAVKRDLVLEAIAKAEKLEATAEEVDQELAELAKAYNQDAAEVKKMLTMSGDIVYFEYNIKLKKANELIYSNAVIK